MGTFHRVDADASGTVALEHLADGSFAVVFEEFTIANAEHTNVILVPNADVTNDADIDQTKIVDLGRSRRMTTDPDPRRLGRSRTILSPILASRDPPPLSEGRNRSPVVRSRRWIVPFTSSTGRSSASSRTGVFVGLRASLGLVGFALFDADRLARQLAGLGIVGIGLATIAGWQPMVSVGRWEAPGRSAGRCSLAPASLSAGPRASDPRSGRS